MLLIIFECIGGEYERYFPHCHDIIIYGSSIPGGQPEFFIFKDRVSAWGYCFRKMENKCLVSRQN